MPLAALILIVAAAAWRVLALHAPALANFAPVMALAFCGGAYFRRGWIWAVPFAALVCSDLYIDRAYALEFHYRMPAAMEALRLACFAAGLLLGLQVALRRTWARLLGGALGASLLFYAVTNTGSFLADAGYAHTLSGWWQALTLGHPGFAPTLYFFRNSLASDLLFTGVFAVGMEYAALRRGDPSLLTRAA